ncbi:MAG TPA: DUF3794 domain-containing protein [Symbiobacteriaceae bacterium]|nr:DUF3794 domain-containing protein [Symbiobacteriaceae bacterium]
MGTGHYSVRLVAGVGRTEELVSGCLDLPEPAAEILEWRKSVMVQHVEVIHGGVILTGHVRSRCLFLTPDRAPPRPPAAISGRVLHLTAQIGFALHIRVRGAAPGMDVRVTAAHVLADASEPRPSAESGWIAGVTDRSLISLAVRVVRPELLQIHKPGRRRRKRRALPPLPKAKPAAPQAPPPPRKAAPARRKRSRPAGKPPLPPPRGSGLWLHPSAAVPVTDGKPRCD